MPPLSSLIIIWIEKTNTLDYAYILLMIKIWNKTVNFTHYSIQVMHVKLSKVHVQYHERNKCNENCCLRMQREMKLLFYRSEELQV